MVLIYLDDERPAARVDSAAAERFINSALSGNAPETASAISSLNFDRRSFDRNDSAGAGVSNKGVSDKRKRREGGEAETGEKKLKNFKAKISRS